MDYSAIVVAAGSGARSGLQFNKILYPYKEGRIIDASIRPFLEDEECRQLILVISPNDADQLADLQDHPKIELVNGGKTRMESVYAGLEKAKEDTVFIHDGARPFFDEVLLARLKKAKETAPAAILAIPVRDTIKRLDKDGLQTVDRKDLYQIQTPQAFVREPLVKAYQKAFKQNLEATDDAQVAEQAGLDVQLVKGSLYNIKVTEPEDFEHLS